MKIADVSAAELTKKEADREALAAYRKQSAYDGSTIVVSKAGSIKHMTKEQVGKLSASKLKALASAYHETVQGGTGGTRERVGEFVDDMIPPDFPPVFLKDLLVEIGVEVEPATKLARWGLLFQVARAGGMQYADEISDAVVLHEQYTAGEEGEPTDLFWTMLYILLLPIAMNVIFAVLFNQRKGAKAVSLAVLVEILHLGPVVKGWKVWKGEGRGQDDVVDPYMQFLMGRVSELIFEGLPELVLAMAMLYTGKATTKVVVSLCVSLASAAFMMMDASVGDERNEMNGQKRGPHSHPTYGFLPLAPAAAKVQQLGLFVFYSGTVATAASAIAAAIVVSATPFIPAVMTGEFALLTAFMGSRGQKYMVAAPAKGGAAFSTIVYLGFYLDMCIAPWTTIRDPVLYGGGFFCFLIGYRLVTYAGVVYAATSAFAGSGVTMAAGTTRQIFGGGAAAIAAGAALVFCMTPSSHRKTWYSSKLAGPKIVQWYFDASQLVSGADTVDQQRVKHLLEYHPSYFNEDAAKEWLLSLQVATPLLTAPDKRLPKGCVQFTGHSLASVFERLVERFAFYSDTPSQQQVRTHLTALAQQIAAATPSQKAIAPVGGGADAQAGGEPNDARVEKLERQLVAKDKEMRAKDARHKREMEAKDREIEELRGMRSKN
ncbi:hypothetical protein TeGR_g7238 [Tetraparma gracilis]|uniref:Uncharacterized protein n=1 Tax=Tetraparma gracilis TaxID=2962635 RepID=A0ABQ6MRJ7_9STRA|nr:hypothetical protein TeGR_g7238 [Tetraparma gracilis]